MDYPGLEFDAIIIRSFDWLPFKVKFRMPRFPIWIGFGGRSISHCRRCVRRRGTDPYARAELADALLSRYPVTQGQLMEAAQELTVALALFQAEAACNSPRQGPIAATCLQLGDVLNMLGHRTQARVYWRLVIEIAPLEEPLGISNCAREQLANNPDPHS